MLILRVPLKEVGLGWAAGGLGVRAATPARPGRSEQQTSAAQPREESLPIQGQIWPEKNQQNTEVGQSSFRV